MRLVLLCCVGLLTACTAMTSKRPLGAGVIAPPRDLVVTPVVVTAGVAQVSPPAPVDPNLHEEIPRLGCGRLSQEDKLNRSLVEERIKDGSYYAALAQVRTLPANAASVALLRADILRHVDVAEAARWYGALLDTCEAGHARHGLGLLAAERGDYPAALPLLQAAADAYPAEARVRHDLGVVQMHLGQDAAATFNLRTASELAPTDAQPQFSLMLLSLLRGDASEWQGLRARWQPDAALRQSLRQSCQQVLRVRQGYRAAGAAGQGSGHCPVDPV